MRFLLVSVFSLPLVSALLLGVAGLNTLFDRADITSDVCSAVNGMLAVTNPWNPSTTIVMGSINACLCISTLPSFIATNSVAISASALVGKAEATSALTKMINTSTGHKTCHYPPHSVPACQPGNACGFTCKDGGQTACGVISRNAKSWECIDTQNDLESCGGCIIPLHSQLSSPEGEDCTAIPGVSDVSCIRGGCVVHRCRPGYDINSTGSSCVYVEEKDPVILAAQYGLEHIPL
ncbi:Protein priA [Hypsizygus marmoreus]|uniref:Protein priA n=1 Tax=Hypsizygus marmoreus TaxID=39966 RepID=A0A369JTD0_HYPMA|nr:Protein priA [Hypsizygus marmoreus]